jgi:hypothetical protein
VDGERRRGGCRGHPGYARPLLLPLLRRYQHDQLVARTADCDRPPASLYVICRGGQLTNVAARLIAQPASLPGQSRRRRGPVMRSRDPSRNPGACTGGSRLWFPSLQLGF